MARARMLSVDVAADPEVNQLSMEAELLYLRSIPHLDRDGLITGRSVLLWALAAPLRVELMDKAKVLIDEWVQQGLVLRYDGPDGPVLFFRGFRRHQANMPYRKESPSKFPPPPGWFRLPDGLIPDDDDARLRLAEKFDVRSGYRKALMSGSGVGRDLLPTTSRRGRAEDQDQDQVEVQVQDQDQAHAFDDDDVGLSPPPPVVKEKETRDPSRTRTRLSEADAEDEAGTEADTEADTEEPSRGSILEAWAGAMIDALWGVGEWSDSRHYLSQLGDYELENLAVWLWKCHAETDWFVSDKREIGVGLIRKMVKDGASAGLPTRMLREMETDIAGFADPSSLFEPMETPNHANLSIDY